VLERQRTQFFLKPWEQKALHDPLELIEEAGNDKLHRVGTPSFGVGRDNPILKLAIPTSKCFCYLNFARGSANGEITMLLGRWRAGEPAAFDELVPLVYPQLRQIAAAYVQRELNPDVVQATVLVHELYLRLLNQKKADWEDRRHFFIFCARLMRMMLIDHARENQIKMRGCNCNSVPLNEDLLWVKIDSPELLDLNRALDELAEIDADKIKLVELRYFLGCTAEETSEVMQVSKATVDREMKFIKGWLFQRIHPGVNAVHDRI
jgi:RNA polymerase sigma factor (TIGR02999 family)